MSKCTFSLFVLLLCCTQSWAQQNYMRIVQWNVENLFDCKHDTLKDDFEFLPEGTHRWTTNRYWRKIEDVGRVIMAIGGDCPPALIGLCEVENDSVMETLTRHSTLWSLGYKYVMTDSPDPRGVDVALMFQPEMFRLKGSESFRIPSAEHGYKPTRDILHAWGETLWGDTLHVMVCHLPSRASETRESDQNRALGAQTLRAKADSILASGHDVRLVVMGDFNAGPRDVVFSRWIRPFLPQKGIEKQGLYTLTPQKKFAKLGTYYFQHNWEWIDHILVSLPLIHIDSQTSIYVADWMKEEDVRGIWHPKRTFLGPAYHGGVSDHLPIYWDLREY